jgi:multidrug resistance protein MdtO
VWEFLREELAPYPQRAPLVGRMVLAATITMIIAMAFRIPFGFQGPVLALFVSRESTQATIKSAMTMIVATILGAIFVLACAPFFTMNSILHFVWVGVALFIVFFALSTVNSYIGVLLFAVVVAVALPLWDRSVTAETNVIDTLWLVWSTLVGVIVAALVELVFAHLRPGDPVIFTVAERLAAVEGVLRCYEKGDAVSANAQREINRFALLGTSLARRYSARSGFNLPYVARAGGVISLVGTLVDTTSSLTQLSVRPDDRDRQRAGELADKVAQLRTEFLERQMPEPISFKTATPETPGMPLLGELEQTVALIPQVFATPAPEPQEERTPAAARLLAHDAFTNPAHLQFGVKGALAAMICYVFYTAVNWPEISTSAVTCVFTALTTIGASRQKQVLRFAGAAVGGFVFGIGAQIFILPDVDSIFGFTILFVIVTAISGWIMTSSPRISYFGVQIAVAFYFIHLQSFRFETSLVAARDRVVGILVGLFAMWLIFDQLWGSPAGVEMRRSFVTGIRMLAQLAREPDMGDRSDAVRRAYALGQTINTNFDQTRALADGVLFEFGPSRSADLAFRERIKQCQPRLRALFLLRGAAIRYRLELPGFELPKAMDMAQAEFDAALSASLDDMADRLEDGAVATPDRLPVALNHLEEDARASGESSSTHLKDFMALSRTAGQLAIALAKDVGNRERPASA